MGDHTKDLKILTQGGLSEISLLTMDADWHTFDDGSESPSGSGAGGLYNDTVWSYHTAQHGYCDSAQQDLELGFDEDDQTLEQYTHAVQQLHGSYSVQKTMLKGRERYSAKQGPSWDPGLSYWRFETDVWDWNDVTTLDVK